MVELADEAKKDTILIVDDTPENIALITSLLKGLYRTKVATNGRKALQVVVSNDPPDLILLDIMMPEMDGYETCRRLKSNPQTADIPVIFSQPKHRSRMNRPALKWVPPITSPSRSARRLFCRV